MPIRILDARAFGPTTLGQVDKAQAQRLIRESPSSQACFFTR